MTRVTARLNTIYNCEIKNKTKYYKMKYIITMRYGRFKFEDCFSEYDKMIQSKISTIDLVT